MDSQQQLLDDGYDLAAQKAMKTRYLRLAALFLPAIAFTIPYAVYASGWHWSLTSPVLPTIGLAPLGLGTIFALLRAYYLDRATTEGEYRIRLPSSANDRPPRSNKVSQWLEAIANFLCASGILIVLLFTWSFASRGGSVECWYASGRYCSMRVSLTVDWLGAYATVPMAAAMAMHAHLAWKTKPFIPWHRDLLSGRPALCSNCHAHLGHHAAEDASPKMSGAAV